MFRDCMHMYVYTSILNNHTSIFMVDKYMLAIAEKAFMIVVNACVTYA